MPSITTASRCLDNRRPPGSREQREADYLCLAVTYVIVHHADGSTVNTAGARPETADHLLHICLPHLVGAAPSWASQRRDQEGRRHRDPGLLSEDSWAPWGRVPWATAPAAPLMTCWLLALLLLPWTVQLAGGQMVVQTGPPIVVSLANKTISFGCKISYKYTPEFRTFILYYYKVYQREPSPKTHIHCQPGQGTENQTHTVECPVSVTLQDASATGTYYCTVNFKPSQTTVSSRGTFILVRDSGYREPPQSFQKPLLFGFTIVLTILSILGTALVFWKKNQMQVSKQQPASSSKQAPSESIYTLEAALWGQSLQLAGCPLPFTCPGRELPGWWECRAESRRPDLGPAAESCAALGGSGPRWTTKPPELFPGPLTIPTSDALDMRVSQPASKPCLPVAGETASLATSRHPYDMYTRKEVGQVVYLAEQDTVSLQFVGSAGPGRLWMALQHHETEVYAFIENETSSDPRSGSPLSQSTSCWVCPTHKADWSPPDTLWSVLRPSVEEGRPRPERGLAPPTASPSLAHRLPQPRPGPAPPRLPGAPWTPAGDEAVHCPKGRKNSRAGRLRGSHVAREDLQHSFTPSRELQNA
ncbi:PREDICTED: uncharacterized protein LOC102871779 [Elephantulus edwardii]|uniref:uncharacterized protein LOC102871779 n=1 Tax=Elephantulus edwardii TaxID=28737 RepID=UPI0003F09F24|nr:PREDICTED: uncharacterized protein LOC102871779 [Elephantulus edwardii]